ncbi:hypothetical protein [Rhodococcus sp. SORGH_AS_0301]|uniref:hypothetical protein n=1 Tax=Rhodococcus sp. SORGH_AS_0301 TaxID=3041780 RepID=UPI00278525AC|nr:hypothetical protein [Rhodococcus sp. SORGH_AS_0301]MDQ1180812.1 restriction system protein [Rhodococcus sp. SORGH_AS_0301]
MAKRRGFFAEIQHQNRLREQRERQQQRATAQAHARATREAERSRKEWERNRAADARRAAALTAAQIKEQARLHVQARQAEVDLLNATLAQQLEDIDAILAATLEVDDYVDLASLRQPVQHPPFSRPDLTQPAPPPLPPPLSPEPVYVEPAAPARIGAVLGGKKKHAAAIEAAQAQYWEHRRQWEQYASEHHAAHQQAETAHRERETQRLNALAAAQSQYEAECAQRRTEILAANVRLEKLMTGLQEREPAALEEYVSIVLANSAYPECFEVELDFAFDGAAGELTLTVHVPHPDALPTEKAFKYTKASDSITSTPLPVKARKDRYATAVCQVALRTAHEIFEADRDGIVATLSMTVGVDAVDPATGRDHFVELVQLATDRASFEVLDLGRVDARATLDHLRAGVSKNPHDLVPVSNSRGVRG